jgi:hypothetical protein
MNKNIIPKLRNVAVKKLSTQSKQTIQPNHEISNLPLKLENETILKIKL